MAVFFDATGTTSTVTTRPFHDPEYRWDFGDAASGTWNAGSKPGVSSRNSATGPVAAHVFESPGTYTVTLNVFGGTNTASSQVQITVLDPNVVFSGANTICFSTLGNFTGAPAGFCTAPGATAITTSNFVTVMTYAATGKRLLLRRGEIWTAASPGAIVNTGPGIVGAFGSGAIPVIKATVNGIDIVQASSKGTPGISDWRIMDLELDGSLVSPIGNTVIAVDGVGGINQLTLLRVNIHDVHAGLIFDPGLLDYWNGPGGKPGHTIWDQLCFVDSTLQHIVGGGGGVGTYLGAKNFALLGNLGTDTTNAEHVIRSPYINKGVISNNTLSDQAAGKHLLKIHGPTWSGGNPPSSVTGDGYTQQVVISDNKFVNGPADIAVNLGPQNGISDERLRNVITERNWFVASSSQQTPIQISAVDQTIRNNLVDQSGALFHNGITVSQKGIEPAPNNVRIYNNTVYSGTTGDFYGVTVGTASNTTVENNLGYAPNATNPVMVLDSGTGTVKSNNSSNSQVKNSSPNWASGSPVNPANFKITAGSYTIDAGLAIPVFSDFFRQGRPNGGAIDLGATEF